MHIAMGQKSQPHTAAAWGWRGQRDGQQAGVWAGSLWEGSVGASLRGLDHDKDLMP